MSFIGAYFGLDAPYTTSARSRSDEGLGIWVEIELLTGFLVFEGLFLSLGFLLTESNVFTWTILGRLLMKDVLCGFGLTLIHLGTARFLTS